MSSHEYTPRLYNFPLTVYKPVRKFQVFIMCNHSPSIFQYQKIPKQILCNQLMFLFPFPMPTPISLHL